MPADDAPILITLSSDVGEPIARGKSYRYGVVNAQINVAAKANLLTVEIEGEERWSGTFQLPEKLSTLQTGHYESKTGWPLHQPALGGLMWTGEGNGCTASAGTIDIDRVTYSDGELRAVDMRFVQYCNAESNVALRGTVRWAATDPTPRNQPLPIPDTLWRAPAAALPGSGNYVYVTGDALNFVIEGQTYLYKSSDAELRVSPLERGLAIAVTAAQRWDMRFVPMLPQTKLQPGYYAFVSGKKNPAFGFMEAYGGRSGHGCQLYTGWFAVDRADYEGAQLTGLDVRFETTCGALQGVMRGQVHWRLGDSSLPAGPVNPMPAGLWAPPVNVLPTGGNVFYLESDAGDYVGRGQKVLHTSADAYLGGRRSVGNTYWFTIDGDERWTVSLAPMLGLQRLEPGYYGNLADNPVLGALTVGSQDYNCTTGASTGWFAVDSISHDSGGELQSVDVRFEQRCSGGSGPALRGRLRWMSSDLTPPNPPVNPPPSSLWAPAASLLPASGNYVYLESAPKDFVGAGRSYLYTTLNAMFKVSGDLDFSVQGDERWDGQFRHIKSDKVWRPGYYAKLRNGSVYSPARGGVGWGGEGRGCGYSNGWIVVDAVNYDANGLRDIELRFEQYCDGGADPLRGKLRWSRDDISLPPGPLYPVPNNLWSAPISKLPPSGSYFYAESDATDFIGSAKTNQAHTYVYQIDASRLQVFNEANGIELRFNSQEEDWNLTVSPMRILPQLQPGYYADAQEVITGNPAKGGLSVRGMGRACNTSHGWYAIDAIRFDNGKLAQLDMRFEQRCDEGKGGALRGQIHLAP